MAGVYIISDDGSSKVMERVSVVDEDHELQRILEKNHDLLPGDQINPDYPRRWLLIKREMPVPDPGNAIDRYSLDFLFTDQEAIPTLVECKRFANPQSRREVVGQMIEYAANGHYYWDKDKLLNFAKESARGQGSTLDQALRVLQEGPTYESSDEFFDKIQQNLRDGKLRIVFFLEKSSMELRSVVDFLSKQMERSEILLVEARQYRLAGTLIVVPTLFGYTEEARKAMRSIIEPPSRRQWDENSYFSDAQPRLDEQGREGLQSIYKKFKSLGFDLVWGNGSSTGSFNVKVLAICPRSLITVFSNGRLNLNFGAINGSETAERCREKLKALASDKIGLKIPNDYLERYPGYPVTEWGHKVNLLVDGLSEMVAEFRTSAEPVIPTGH